MKSITLHILVSNNKRNVTVIKHLLAVIGCSLHGIFQSLVQFFPFVFNVASNESIRQLIKETQKNGWVVFNF